MRRSGGVLVRPAGSFDGFAYVLVGAGLNRGQLDTNALGDLLVSLPLPRFDGQGGQLGGCAGPFGHVVRHAREGGRPERGREHKTERRLDECGGARVRVVGRPLLSSARVAHRPGSFRSRSWSSAPVPHGPRPQPRLPTSGLPVAHSERSPRQVGPGFSGSRSPARRASARVNDMGANASRRSGCADPDRFRILHNLPRKFGCAVSQICGDLRLSVCAPVRAVRFVAEVASLNRAAESAGLWNSTHDGGSWHGHVGIPAVR